MRKFRVVDLFAGAGGFGLGFHLANFEVICSLEKDNWAIKTLMSNRLSHKKIIHEDIRNFKTEEQIKKICPFKPNVIIGGPPCQGFSNARSGRKHSNDSRNSLFKYFGNWVKFFKPEVFVLENVKGMLTWKNNPGKKNNIIVRTLENLGYHVEIWRLNAAEYGVPQNRERIFIVGNIYETRIKEPKKTHYIPHFHSRPLNSLDKCVLEKAVTVWQALSDLSTINAGQGQEKQAYTKEPINDYQKWTRTGSTNLYNHVSMKHTGRLIERFKKIQEGYLLSDIPKDYKVKKRNGNGKLSKIDFNSNYRLLKKNRISYTIPAHFYSSFIHPTRPRNLTAREAARIQSFPDWYKFMGKRTVVSSKLLKRLGKHDENYLSQYNQIGNAVPPLLAKAIALHLLKYLKNKSKKLK